ncbi:MAG: phosphate-starvation-inducible PsiE family protein [Gammaproteobacteria bacterium]|nr:phosphate-starvation-inducible PsiE family protein [Gammaproteobacteria bacterium]MCL5669224.1 phosphate-starvation-inducible PsiE family protein [Gammaproteobacteria bacterium]
MKRISQSPGSPVMRALYAVEWAGLLLISIATVVAIGQETLLMVERGEVLLQDILLLFIYLEILTMVGLYFTSGKLPVRYPVYIAMVAIARFIIMGMKDMNGWEIVALALAILILALAVLAIRYGHTRMPYDE